MPHWMCTACGFLVSEEDPPAHCSGCNRKGRFNDVTCYRAECGGEENVDPLLVGATLRAIGRKGGPRGQSASKPTPVLPEHLEAVAIFRGLSEEQIAKVLELSKRVDSGRVAINTSIQDGKWAPVCIVSAGGIFGWSCLVPPYQLTASATTFEETKVTLFEGEALKELFSREPAIGYVVIQNVGGLISSRLKNARLELIGVVFM
jgi:rubredoxin